MSIIPEENLKSHLTFNFAPMIDFLFLMLAFFATLAISRASLYDTKLKLVKLKTENNAPIFQNTEDTHHVNLSITEKGEYKWITEINDYPISAVETIQRELLHQYKMGILPSNKTHTRVLLHIDKHAPWEPIARLIYAVQETGFEVHPIYEKDSQ